MNNVVTKESESALSPTQSVLDHPAQDSQFHQDRMLRLSGRKAGIYSAFFRGRSTASILTAAANSHVIHH
jgi:hypothetical protein